MKVIVKRVTRGNLADGLNVVLVVDGVEKEFLFRVVLPGLSGITTEDQEFLDLFRHSRVIRRIAKIVIDEYQGVSVALPLDLGDV